MVLFAKLILSLCCNNPSATNHVQKSLDIVNKSFSLDMRNVIHYLMKPPGPLKVCNPIKALRLAISYISLHRIYKVFSIYSEVGLLRSMTLPMRKFFSLSLLI